MGHNPTYSFDGRELWHQQRTTRQGVVSLSEFPLRYFANASTTFSAMYLLPFGERWQKSM